MARRKTMDRVNRSISISVENAEWILARAEREERSFNYIVQTLVTKARRLEQAEKGNQS